MFVPVFFQFLIKMDQVAHLLLIPVYFPVAFKSDGRDVLKGNRSGRFFGQLNLHAMLHQRRGDHKNDQKNQHNIDKWRDVDFRQ